MIDPEIWTRLVGRVRGANFGAIYGRTKAMGYRSITPARGAYLAVLHKVPAGYAAQAASKQLCKKIQDLDSVLARNGRRAL